MPMSIEKSNTLLLENMTKNFNSIFILFVGTACIFTAHGLFSTLIPIHLQASGKNPEIAGFIMSAYYAGMIPGSILCHKIITNIGHIRAYAVFSAILAICILLIAISINPFVWMIIRLLSGFFMAGLVVTIESWLNYNADEKHRGKIIAAYMITLYASLGLGQFLLYFLGYHVFALFALIVILVCCSIIPITLTNSAQPKTSPTKLFSIWELYSISPIGVVGSISSGMILGAFYGLGPLFAQDIGFAHSEIGFFMGVTIISGLIIQFPIGKLSDIYDRRLIMIGVAILLLVSSISMAFADKASPIRLIITMVLLGGGMTSLSPLSMAHTHTFLNQDQRISGSSTLILTSNTGAIIGPFIAGPLMTLFGTRSLFIYTMYVASFFIVFMAFKIIYQKTAVPLAHAKILLSPERTPAPYEMTIEPYALSTESLIRDINIMKEEHEPPAQQKTVPQKQAPQKPDSPQPQHASSTINRKSPSLT